MLLLKMGQCWREILLIFFVVVVGGENVSPLIGAGHVTSTEG